MSKHPPTLDRCPFCGEPPEYAVDYTIENPREKARRDKALDGIGGGSSSIPNARISTVNLELLRPCDHGFPADRLDSLDRAIKATGLDSPETFNALNSACSRVLTIEEETRAEHEDGSPGTDSGTFTPPG